MLYNQGIKECLRSNKITVSLIKNFIQSNIFENDSWLYRSLVVLYNHQTNDEQLHEDTYESNGIGFSGVDAKLLSSYAKQYIERKFLTPKQKLWCRNKIVKYWSQIWNISDQDKMIQLINSWRNSDLEF